MPRVLILAPHRLGRNPCQRFRFEQYISHLGQNGFAVDFSPLLDEHDDKALYSEGNVLQKARVLGAALTRRLRDLSRYSRYDIVFVQREAWMLGSAFFERRIASSGAKFIFDFDDSIWLMDTSQANKRWEWLKNPLKTAENIGMADLVFAGNDYLADYARRFSKRVTVVPTTIDTDEYVPRPPVREGPPRPVVIGWSGSLTTIRHFQYAADFLPEIRRRFGDRVEFHVIGDASYEHPGLGIRGKPWVKATELDDLRMIDIGIMPLPDDEWARGKCGLKGLQYMALAIPTVMSPVGVNKEIIHHGKDGFLSATSAEWVDSLSRLVESAALRAEIGAQARQTVVSRFSALAQRDSYVRNFRSVLPGR